MKKFLFVVAFICTMFTFSNVEASNYQINDAKIDVLFEKASTTIMMNLTDMSSNLMTSTANLNSSLKAKDPLLAIVLDFFLGGLGIHRFYLGTKVMTGVGYILTCGGIFGLVPLVDFIVLIINYDDISQFVDNPKFFMW
ncbi:TM2 domain-containing protein [Ancylomarina euxinus]|uniref:TM2 domain-containing protein n=1 Tax=Ancylomarina euxinus TaxID=2283627 RepID=A0A425Y5Y5_9BACT|nr:TM2 domain-containing protein [Ancylomarina euxinus]MCZ4694208.1 TM2 domain-containing protein [Ancylomarina euxinus]MUP14461.1 NINE protein [Ancylomarina euxinus]RRG23764.1 TM2 domain-containing protein [Ancylomarina euxinus]